MSTLYTLEDIRQRLKLRNRTEARNRLEHVRRTLEAKGWLTRVERNALAVTYDGLRLIDRLQELHENGMTMDEAAIRISEEIGVQGPPIGERIAAVEVKVAALNKRIVALEAARPWWTKLFTRTPALEPPKE